MIGASASGSSDVSSSAHRGIGHLAIGLSVLLAACGKSGPPLPPLRLVPAPVSAVAAQRTGNEVRLTFTLPTANANGPGPVDLQYIEVYAGTVAPGASAPANRDLLVPKYLVGRIEVKQPVPEGKPQPPERPGDTRPSAGEKTTFVEEITAAKLTPVFTSMPVAPAPAPPATAPATAAGVPVPAAPTPATPTAAPAPTAPAGPAMPTRIYTVRGVTRSGRPGSAAGRVTVPLIDPPAPPAALAVRIKETGLSLAWTAPVSAAEAAHVKFNVYGEGATTPLNPAPLDTPAFERAGVEFGKEECFVVRSVVAVLGVSIESAPSERVCVTAADIFPPAAPKGLQAVASTGAINLIWDANTEADLAGYVVLRGEAPGDKLQALTPAPIRDTTFRDATAQPGIRYVYAIIAVDRATPPNMSPQSNRAEETAR